MPDEHELSEPEAWGAISRAGSRESAPDDAPPCDQPDCDRLGVIEQVVTGPGWTRVWHWCVSHDPEAL